MGTREVKIDDQQFHLISKALSDPKRFEMLQQIGASKDAPSCTCIRESSGLAPATISHHLKELENAGLIRIERVGKFARITLKRETWNGYLKRLSQL